MQKKIEQTESRILTPGQKQHLADKGYIIVPNVLSNDEVEIALGMFKGWQATIPNHNILYIENATLTAYTSTTKPATKSMPGTSELGLR